MTQSAARKPGVVFWATVVVVVGLAAYPVSVGPAFWLASRDTSGRRPRFSHPAGAANAGMVATCSEAA